MSDARIEEIQRFNPQWWPPNEPIERCTILICSQKQLTNVPGGISLLSNLVRLDLNDNLIAQVPSWISILTRLEILQLFNNQITSMPNGISRLTNLTLLRVDGNQITTIPDGISCLTGLNGIYLFNNQITSVPNGISRLTNLRLLRVESNQITTIPDGISCLTGLNDIYLFNNQITSVPNGISRLTNLTVLRVESNKITTIPDGILCLTGLNQFEIHTNQISVVPTWISCITGLNALQLFNNQITSVPNGISRLTNLTLLRVDGNQITTIPDGISCLMGLNALQLDSNQITSVPNGISRLTNLTVLRVESNKVTTIPDGVSCLTGLSGFNWFNNQITSLPNGISRFTNLTTLLVYGNQITTIPDGVSCLTGLTVLSILGNPIQELPPGISCLLKLEQFYIQDSNGTISVKRAPRGISNLPCWNCATVYGGMSIANALRKLTLYDPVTFSTPSILSPRQHASTPTSRLAAGKFADILTEEFEAEENILGKGGFGLVFKVQLNAGTFAVKKIADAALHKAVPGSTDPEKEGEMMLKLKHPNILALHDFGFRNRDLLFIMEYADGGDLCSFIKKNKALNLDVSMKYGLHIIQGLVFLHTCTPAIQHRDLKTENVLLVQGAAKLTDFGLSKSGASVNSASGFKGSKNWSPPEAFDYGKSMGLPSDVYSYGVVLWSMITGEYPYEGLSEREVGKKVMDGNLPLPPTCPANLAALIHRCWEKDYENRIKAIDVEKLLKDVMSNPAAPPTPRSKSVKDMNSAELFIYLEAKNVLKRFIDAVRDNEVSGEDFLELDEDALTSVPFSLPKFQARVILRFIEEAKRT